MCRLVDTQARQVRRGHGTKVPSQADTRGPSGSTMARELPELNPILIRELRTRWRSWRFLLWPAAGVIVSSAAVAWVITRKEYIREEAPLVWTITGAQIAFVVAVAPVLAAAAVAADRRSGNLDTMRITRLSVHQIVLGKVLACLQPLALTFFCQLPLFIYISQARPIGPAPIAAYVLSLEMAGFLACAGIGVAMTEARGRGWLGGAYLLCLGGAAWLAFSVAWSAYSGSVLWSAVGVPFVLLVGAPTYVLTVDVVSRRLAEE
ncbi:MAG: hypothetical protein PVH68_00470 [Armatimonadota bacterium]|jgi:hypothetical protein